MADIKMIETKKSNRQKKHNLRIDFTPMVDLGFLLITFFMLTTSLSKPHVMPLIMPDTNVKVDDFDELEASKVLTVLLGGNNHIYFYEGLSINSLNSTDFSSKGLREVILKKKKKVRNLYPDIEKTKADGSKRLANQLYVLIKPLSESVYRNTVDVLDEMAICGVSYYTILEPTQKEIEAITQ